MLDGESSCELPNSALLGEDRDSVVYMTWSALTRWSGRLLVLMLILVLYEAREVGATALDA